MLHFVLQHGYLVVFLAVLAEQIGLPVPSVPLLLAMGALSGLGQMNYAIGLAVCLFASLPADLMWYWLGRTRGASILSLLCRISLEPDSCVRRTENVFLRYGAKSLLFAKFVPGLGTAATPMTGVFRMPLWRFLIFDGLGALIWAGSYSLIGVAFRSQMDLALDALQGMGRWLILLVFGALATYILVKYIQRRRFLGKLRVARIAPAELMSMMEAGEPHVIVDLRNTIEQEDDPARIPGALAIAFEELEARNSEIPRDRDVILYCT